MARRRAARARLRGHRAAGRARLRQRVATLDAPEVVLLDALRLRAAVLSEPRRRRPALRARRLRREGDSGGAGRGRRTAARGGERRVGLLFVVGEERGSDGARAANRSRPARGSWSTASRPTAGWRRHARRAARASCSARGRAGAFVRARARRVGDRQADRRAGAAARDAAAVRSGARDDVLQRRADRGRRRAERDLAARVGRGDVPDRRRRRRVLRGDRGRWSRSWRSRRSCGCRRSGCTRSRASRPRCFPFTTDVPLLDRWGAPLLFGPGSFLVAHTDEEHLALDELDGRSTRTNSWRWRVWRHELSG